MRAYKVVRNFDGILLSHIASGQAEVIYRLNKWIKAPKWLRDKGYHLFVYKDLEKAIESLEGNSEIYECEVDELIEGLPQFLNLYILDLGEIKPINYSFPEGTYMTKKIKLLRKVWPKD